MSRKRSAKNRLIAVIDIGSNSVRLVVFKGLKRAPEIFFNERVLCGLGGRVTSKGIMSKKSMDLAFHTLQRFALLCRDMEVDIIETVATSAVRDASNGPEFVKRVETACGFKIKVLSGEKEARLSAVGVFSGFINPRGVIGDLGGGSLELIAVGDNKILHKVSLPIGPIRLLAEKKQYRERDLKVIREHLDQVHWLKNYRDQPFYLVGGAWRAIAHLHIVHTGWALPVLHGYILTGNVAEDFANMIARESETGLEQIGKIPRGRAGTIPLSAQILLEVLKRQKPEIVITSAYGIREGLMYSKKSMEVRAHDPLLAACKRWGASSSRFPNHGKIIMKWINPLFQDEKPGQTRIRLAASYLADLCWNNHPDFKAELAFSRTLVGWR